MKTTESIALVLYYLAVCGPSFAAEDAAQQAEILRQIGEAIDLGSSAYEKRRDMLVVRAKRESKHFTALAASSDSWKVRSLCFIIMEAAVKDSSIRKFLAWKPDHQTNQNVEQEHIQAFARQITAQGYGVPNEELVKAWRIDRIGKDVAIASTETPWIIFEHFWKRLSFGWGLEGVDERACLARALRETKVEGVRELWEDGLADGNASVRRECAVGLAELHDSRGVRSLLAFLEREAYDSAAYPAGVMALAKCVDRKSLPLLKVVLRGSGSAEMKRVIMMCIYALEGVVPEE